MKSDICQEMISERAGVRGCCGIYYIRVGFMWSYDIIEIKEMDIINVDG